MEIEPISKLGLELIELEDQVLLVDKLEHTNNRLILHQSINGKVNHFYKGDDLDLEDYNARRFLGLTFNVIASTKPLEGLPLLVIEDEAHELSKKYLDATSYEKESDDQFIGRYSGFVSGYNKAKETYKFTEEDLREAICEAWNSCEDNEDEETFTQVFNRIIQSLTKKELWIQTTISLYKGNGTYGMEIPKIINNQIKAVWK